MLKATSSAHQQLPRLPLPALRRQPAAWHCKPKHVQASRAGTDQSQADSFCITHAHTQQSAQYPLHSDISSSTDSQRLVLHLLTLLVANPAGSGTGNMNPGLPQDIDPKDAVRTDRLDDPEELMKRRRAKDPEAFDKVHGKDASFAEETGGKGAGL